MTLTGGELEGVGRIDANILNLFAFTATRHIEGSADTKVLVLGLNLDNSIDQSLTTYRFSEDMTVEFHVDNDSKVTRTNGKPKATATDDDWMMKWGGTIEDPDKVNEDLTFKVQFKENAAGGTDHKLVLEGLPAWAAGDIRVFSGLRGVVSATGPTVKVAAIIVEVPLDLVLDKGPTLLLWATSNVPEIDGYASDHMGLPNISRKNLDINKIRPRHQTDLISIPEQPRRPIADVLIFDTSKGAQFAQPGAFPQSDTVFNPANQASFPNGRPVSPALASFPYFSAP